MEQREQRADAELPFEADPDIDRDAEHRERKADRAGAQQFFGHLARHGFDRSGLRGRERLLDAGDKLLPRAFGRGLVAIGKRGADRHRAVRPELLDRRLADADLAHGFANILDRRHFLGELDANRLAADEVDAKVQALDRHQRDRDHDKEKAHEGGELAPLQKVVIGVVGDEFEQAHLSLPPLDIDRRRAIGPQPMGDEHARDGNCGEDAGDDPDGQHHREALDRARAEPEHQRRGDDIGDVGVENRAAGLGIAEFDRLERPPPAFQFLADTLVDQYVRIDRRADGQHEACDARQGQRRIECRHDRDDQEDVEDQREVRIDAKAAIDDEHQRQHRHRRDDPRQHALFDRILPKFGRNGALFDDRHLHRQCARTQRDRQRVGARDAEAARNLRAAAQDRFIDRRRRQHLAVEHHRKALADILRGHLGKGARSARIETNRNDRLPGLRVIALLRVDQLLAADHHLAAQDLERRAAALALGIGDDFAAHRHATSSGFGRVGVGVDHAEFEARGLADQLLERGRILQARDLHNDAVIAFADDRRFARAERVDALVDDVARRIHRVRDRLRLSRARRGQHDTLRIDDIDIPVALAGEARTLRLAEQSLARLVELRLIANEEADPAARIRQLADRDIVVGTAVAAHRGAYGLFHIGKLRLAQIGDIGLEQEVATTG